MGRSPSLPPLMAAALLLLALGWGTAPAQEGPPADLPAAAGLDVKRALEAQIEALNGEDPDAVMALFHPQAPGHAQIRRSLVELFRARDLRYALEDYRFVAEDRPYAYARCVQSTHALDGSEPPRRLEQLFVFRREGERWKFWTSVVLSDLTPPAPPGRRR